MIFTTRRKLLLLVSFFITLSFFSNPHQVSALPNACDATIPTITPSPSVSSFPATITVNWGRTPNVPGYYCSVEVSGEGFLPSEIVSGGGGVNGPRTGNRVVTATFAQTYSVTVRSGFSPCTGNSLGIPTDGNGDCYYAQDTQTVDLTLSAAPTPPTVDIKAKDAFNVDQDGPLDIAIGNSTSVTWTSTNATSCTGSGGQGSWSGSKTTSGSQGTGAVNSSLTFTITCTGPGGTASDSVQLVPQAFVGSAQTVCTGTPPATPQIDLSWTPGGYNRFHLHRGPTSGANGSNLIGIINNSTSYTDTTLPNGYGALHQYSVLYTNNLNQWGGDDVEMSSVATCDATITVTESGASGGTWTINPESKTGTNNTVRPSSSGSVYTISPGSMPVTCSTGTRVITTSDSGGVPASSLTIVPGQTKNFAITYSGCSGGTAPLVDIKANGSDNPPSINSGGNVSLTWTTQNSPTSCSASASPVNGNWSGSVGTAASNSQGTFTLSQTTTFSITCSNTFGSASDSVTVTVNAISGSLSLTPVCIGSSPRVNILWNPAQNISGNWGPYYIWRDGNLIASNVVPTSYVDTGPLSASTQYNYVVTPEPNIFYNNQTGSVTTLSCVVNATVDLKANSSDGPISVASGNSATLSWSTTNATSCSASATPANGSWTGSKAIPSGSQSSGALTQATTFTLTCLPGSVSDSVTINISASAPTVDLKVNGSDGPVTLSSSAQNADLTWTSNNATTCSLGAPVNSGVGVNGSASYPYGHAFYPSPSGTTYTLSCSGPGGSGSDSVTVYGYAPATTVTLSASPTSITSGNSSTLTWSTTNATACTASASPANGNWVGSKGIPSGSQSTGALSVSTTFTLNCTGLGSPGSASASVTVGAVPPPPTINLSATPSTITSGSVITITWSTSNATSCTASASPADARWVGAKATAGTTGFTLTTTTQFTLDCTGPGGSNSANATVTVTPATATISVNSNLNTSWSIVGASPANGSGASASHTVTPASGGTVYQLTSVPNIGGYSVSISCTVGGVTTPGCSQMTMFPGNSNSFTITYTPISAFDYSLTNNGNVPVTKSSGNVTGQSIITETLLSGSTQPVTLTASGMPSGVSISYANQGCSPNCSATLTFTVAPSTTAGTYTINVQGNGAGVVKNTSFNLVVSDPAGLSVSCSASPSPALIGQPVTWTAIVTGGTPPFSYQWAGTDFVGTPTANPYVFTYQTTGSKNASVTVTDNTSTTANCPNSVLQVNVQPIFKEF